MERNNLLLLERQDGGMKWPCNVTYRIYYAARPEINLSERGNVLSE